MDNDVWRCPHCDLILRCKDEQCNVMECPECGYELIC